MIRFAPLLFIVIPLIELYFILLVGDKVGALWTVLLVVFTAIAGISLLRIQGMSTLLRAQKNMAQGSIPAMEMMEGVALAVAGILLITPGFITDTIGFLCLIPVTRRAIIHFFMRKSKVQGGVFSHGAIHQKTPSSSSTTKTTGRTIEGEFRREDSKH